MFEHVCLFDACVLVYVHLGSSLSYVFWVVVCVMCFG